MKILIVDNYDSFTYNLVHLVEKLVYTRVKVIMNDEIGLEEIKQYDKIILSPGPGVPQEAGLLLPLLSEYAATKSILGVCLGHQAIAEVFGGKLINLVEVYHGIATSIKIRAHVPIQFTNSIFYGLPEVIEVGRYHSWVVDRHHLPTDLVITAVDDNDYVMGLQHTRYDVQGVQFHPESVLTPQGAAMIDNWLRR